MMVGFADLNYVDSLESNKLTFSDTDLIKRLVRDYMLRHKSLLLVVVLLIGTRMVVTLIAPYIYKVAIDFFIKKTPNADGQWFVGFVETMAIFLSGSSIINEWAFLFVVAIMYVLAGLALWAISSFQGYYINKLGQTIIADIRSDFFHHLTVLSQRFFEQGNTGRLVSRVTNDAEALKSIVSTGTIGLMADCVQIVGVFSVMLVLDAQLAIITLVISVMFGAVAKMFQGWIRSAWRITRIKIASLTSKIQDLMDGTKVTKALVQEERALKEFDGVNEEFMVAQIHAGNTGTFFYAIVGVFVASIEALIWFTGGQRVIGGGRTLGDLIAFSQYARDFLTPIQNISVSYGEIQNALASAERIFSVLDINPEVVEASDAIDLTNTNGFIEFKNVSFSYVKNQSVLQNISFTAKPGERLAIFGPTGAGKSSIVNLIGRFYDPNAGEILLDGNDLKTVKIDSLRHCIGIVMQEPYLLAGTIAYNLKFGFPDATDKEIIKVTKMVGIHDTIMKLEQGYDTEILERGKNLSYGQRQLVCLARTLIADPKVLILDEASSSVDAYTESLIHNALKMDLKNRAVIVITHRVSTVRDVDRIIVLNKGKIQEVGTYEELITKNNLFQKMCQMQLVSTTDE